VAGFDVVRQSRQVRRHIGLSGQLSAVDEKLTGRENLILVGKLYRLGKAGAVRRADDLLERFDLVEAGRRPTGTYSGGMRRRLDLAASLIADPPVLFLDEPTTGLDLTSRLILWQTIREQVKAGTTVLLTTQYLEEADLLADRLAVVDGGRVIASGTPEELKRDVGSERLELAFETVAEADRAHAELGTELPRTADRFGVLVPVTDGLRTVGSIAARLADLDLRPRDFAVRKPSLDDVFLALTGRPTADAEAAPEPGSTPPLQRTDAS
jgi:ABC-2 type transport system ATP-binding protein